MDKMLFNLLNKVDKLTLFRSCSTVSNQKWDLLAAVCIERKPLITPLLNDLEKDYQKYLEEVEHEKSFKSQFEIQLQEDLKQVELIKQGTIEVDVINKQTAQDFLDSSKEELKQFKFADRITNDDKKNNQKSLNRKLDRHLVLVVKQKLGADSHYVLPQGLRNDGETLRQSADRLLKEFCGNDLKAQIFGNAPTGFYKYKYPHDAQMKTGVVGAKVFFYFARYLKGEFSTKGIDYKWLDRNELQKELHPSYHNSISQFLIDEN